MLALSLDTLDGVADNLKGAYVEKNGKFVLDVEVPDVSKFESEITDWKKKHTAAEKLAKTAAETAADLQRKLDAKDATGPETDKKVADLLTKWEAEKNKAVEEARAEERAMRKPLEDRLTVYDLDQVLEKAFIEAGGRGVKKDNAVALAKVKGWTLIDGKAVLKSADGTVLTTSPKDYFGKGSEFNKAESEWYEGSKGTGGNAPGNTGTPIVTPAGFDLNNPGQALRNLRASGATE